MALRLSKRAKAEIIRRKKKEIVKKVVGKGLEAVGSGIGTAVGAAYNVGMHAFSKGILYPIVGNFSANLQLKTEKLLGKYYNPGDAYLQSLFSNVLIVGGSVGYLTGRAIGEKQDLASKIIMGTLVGVLSGVITFVADGMSRGQYMESKGIFDNNWKVIQGKRDICASLPGKIISIPLELIVKGVEDSYSLGKWVVGRIRNIYKTLDGKAEREVESEERKLNGLEERLLPQQYSQKDYEFLAEAEKSTDIRVLRKAMNMYRRGRDVRGMQRIAKLIPGKNDEISVAKFHLLLTKAQHYLEQKVQEGYLQVDSSEGYIPRAGDAEIKGIEQTSIFAGETAKNDGDSNEAYSIKQRKSTEL